MWFPSFLPSFTGRLPWRGDWGPRCGHVIQWEETRGRGTFRIRAVSPQGSAPEHCAMSPEEWSPVSGWVWEVGHSGPQAPGQGVRTVLCVHGETWKVGNCLVRFPPTCSSSPAAGLPRSPPGSGPHRCAAGSVQICGTRRPVHAQSSPPSGAAPPCAGVGRNPFCCLCSHNLVLESYPNRVEVFVSSSRLGQLLIPAATLGVPQFPYHRVRCLGQKV